MIDELIELLSRSDMYFLSFWRELDESERRKCHQILLDIQQTGPRTWAELSSTHSTASARMRHYFACIPHKELDYGRKPRDWSAFVADTEAKNELFAASRSILESFCGCLPTEDRPSLYGNIKSLDSLDRRAARPASPSSPRLLLDTWDIVRFRLVSSDLAGARDTARAIWECFLDEIVRCTNFYVSPSRTDHPYRAIHFEIEMQPRRWIEVQVLSRTRDLIGRLDYAPVFKKSVALPNSALSEWLAELSLRANLYDVAEMPTLPFASIWSAMPRTRE